MGDELRIIKHKVAIIVATKAFTLLFLPVCMVMAEGWVPTNYLWGSWRVAVLPCHADAMKRRRCGASLWHKVVTSINRGLYEWAR